ncbi:lipase 3-like [Formica exsecta]|uniref:lipase 3-like n=1 Tax=Formica exsecta TaxID=72781 RepID=UPI0011426D1A|nr:lipase 3-like [Formica exsecta]
MKLIGIVYLVLFYGYLVSMLTDVTFEPSAFMKIKISWINWIWPNNTGVNPDAILNTVATTLLPVLLQHGLFYSSASWVILGKGKALDNNAIFFHEFLLSDFVRLYLKYVCDQNISGKICSNVMFMIWGYSGKQFNHTLLPVIISHFPAGGSFDTLVHYTQGFQSAKFRQYDYCSAENLLIYNSVEPPDYDLANITVPIALFYGPGDTLDDIMDVKKLYRVLPNVVDVYKIPWRNFNHMDFIWAKDAPKLVYKRVLKIMRSENLNNVTSMEKCYVDN